MNSPLSLWLKRLLLPVALGLISPLLKAQDPSFSQFYANRIYLNPAFAGLESGITLAGVSRIQWLNADQGFRTFGASLETQLPFVGIGLGLHVMSNTEGLANLQSNQAGVVFSYTIPGEKSNLHFGMEGRLVQKHLDWDRLVFSDQLDAIYGVVQNSSVMPVLDQVTYGDFDFGVVWRRVGDLGNGKKRLRNVRSQLGLSFHHLPYLVSKSAKGNDSFLNTESAVAPRTTFHGGLIIPLKIFQGTGFDVSFSPNIKVDMQGYKFLNFQENITVSTVGMYGLVNSFYLGLLYQNRFFAPNATHTDAFILTVGGYAMSSSNDRKNSDPRLFFGASVDINTTGVGPVAGSVFEMTFRYRFLPDINLGSGKNSRSRSGKKILDCKDFF
ncbi:MAG: PorP/SprF family type IX secretion system membrane protein [Saprospiraceae bacterium]